MGGQLPQELEELIDFTFQKGTAMDRIEGMWDKKGVITKEGQRYVMARLKAIRKELKALKENDIYTFDAEEGLRDIYHQYIDSSFWKVQ